MFRRLTEPLPLSAASLLLLRPALNAPVLNVGYLPVGPARAVVVAFGEEYGGIGIALGVRSSEGGQLVVLRNQESIDFDVPLAEALEPLLAEAERMGFLFDEDVFETHPGAAGRAQAMSQWADLMGGMESLIPPREVSEDERRSAEDDGPIGPLSPSLAVDEMQYSELMLDDVAPFVLDGDELGLADDGDETLETDFGDDFEDVLDDDLGGALGGEAEGDRWHLDAPLVGETDLTEPTAPILASGRALEARSNPANPPVVRARVAARADDPAPLRPAPSTGLPAAPSAVPTSALRPGPAPSRVVVEAPVAAPASVQPVAAVAPTAPATPVAPAAPVEPVLAAPAAVPATASSPLPRVATDPEGAAVEKASNGIEPTRPTVAPTTPRVVLSKFRQVEGRPTGTKAGAEKGEVGADRSSELARIPIVRVRRERDAGKRVPFLARLLSSF